MFCWFCCVYSFASYIWRILALCSSNPQSTAHYLWTVSLTWHSLQELNRQGLDVKLNLYFHILSWLFNWFGTVMLHFYLPVCWRHWWWSLSFCWCPNVLLRSVLLYQLHIICQIVYRHERVYPLSSWETNGYPRPIHASYTLLIVVSHCLILYNLTLFFFKLFWSCSINHIW